MKTTNASKITDVPVQVRPVRLRDKDTASKAEVALVVRRLTELSNEVFDKREESYYLRNLSRKIADDNPITKNDVRRVHAIYRSHIILIRE